MKVRVKFFALYRQLVGKEELNIQLLSGATVSDLVEKLLNDFPQLDKPSLKPLIAVNAEYASPEVILKNGDLVAVLPPFSGGNI